jgi:hypothetical protein
MKGRRVLVTFIGVCATLCLMTPSVAQAANTTCANADFLFPGQMGSYFIASSGDLFFKARVMTGRSYAVFGWAPFQDAGEGGAALDVALFSNNTCTTSASGSNSLDYEPFVFVDDHSGDHDSIISAADGTLYIRVSNGVAFAYTIDVMVVETTLFSPWWFTGGTNQAYVEVRNNMNASLTAVLTVTRSNGTVCGTSNVALAANGNAAVEINSVGTCAAALSGAAQISFPGTPGGLAANITTINVPNGTSFDSPFTPRMVWGSFTR